MKSRDVFAEIVPDDHNGDLFLIGKNRHITASEAGKRWKQRWKLLQGLFALITGVQKKYKMAGKLIRSPVMDHPWIICWQSHGNSFQKVPAGKLEVVLSFEHCPDPRDEGERQSPAAPSTQVSI